MLVLLLLSLLNYAALIILGGVVALIVYARWNYGSVEKFKKMPATVKPYFIGGSDPFFFDKVVCHEDMELVKKYGKVFGFYEGREPQVFIADPELIRLIFVKDYSHFPNQRIYEVGHPLFNEMMTFLPYEKHKAVRDYLSPQWTSGKIKYMSHNMVGAIGDWMDQIRTKTSDNNGSYTFVAKKEFTALTTDVLARCIFGAKISSFKNEDEFIENVKQFNFGVYDTDIWDSLTLTFPFIAAWRPYLSTEMMKFFGDLVHAVFKQRKEESMDGFKDVIGSMIGMMEKCGTPEFKKLGITETTVMGQTIIFISAGFETMSNTFSVMSFLLAKNPKVQEKLLTEIDCYLKRHDGKVEHATIGELAYAKAVLNETLRMYPIMLRSERECQKDWVHPQTGLEIKKGTVVMVPIFAVHYDPELFPDPYTFNPDRFMPENKDKLNQYAYLGFGLGHHTCFGMHFAKDEITLAMATVLKEFKFEHVPGSELKFKKGRISVNYYEPYQVKLVRRECC